MKIQSGLTRRKCLDSVSDDDKDAYHGPSPRRETYL
jgi:hypothetical protein